MARNGAAEAGASSVAAISNVSIARRFSSADSAPGALTTLHTGRTRAAFCEAAADNGGKKGKRRQQPCAGRLDVPPSGFLESVFTRSGCASCADRLQRAAVDFQRAVVAEFLHDHADAEQRAEMALARRDLRQIGERACNPVSCRRSRAGSSPRHIPA